MPKKRLVSDANVLIDVEAGRVTKEVFRLGYEIVVPDVLYQQELADYYPELLKLGLKTVSLSETAMRNVEKHLQAYADAGVSRNDLTALVLANENQCPLLTGERSLRDIGEELGIEVHGTLWLMEQLVKTHIIDHNRARQAYEAMRADGSWLPWDKVERQLKRLAAGSKQRG